MTKLILLASPQPFLHNDVPRTSFIVHRNRRNHAHFFTWSRAPTVPHDLDGGLFVVVVFVGVFFVVVIFVVVVVVVPFLL